MKMVKKRLGRPNWATVVVLGSLGGILSMGVLALVGSRISEGVVLTSLGGVGILLMIAWLLGVVD